MFFRDAENIADVGADFFASDKELYGGKMRKQKEHLFDQLVLLFQNYWHTCQLESDNKSFQQYSHNPAGR